MEGAIAFVFEIAISIPLDIIAVTKQYSKTDYVITIVALACFSLPTFFFVNLLKLVFCVHLGWFDLGGLIGRNYEYLSAGGQFLDKAQHLVLPIVTLVVISIGSLPGLFADALITETLYSIPGIGYVSYQSMVAGDIPFSMFYLAFMAILTLLGNLISDRRSARTIEAIKMVGLANAEGVAEVFPHELSGGQRQCIMIAMALACNPKVIIADEPAAPVADAPADADEPAVADVAVADAPADEPATADVAVADAPADEPAVADVAVADVATSDDAAAA